MPIYIWKGTNRYGDPVTGERVSSSPEDLERVLQREQITVASISPMKTGLKIPFLNLDRVKKKDLAIFARQMSVLIDAELPLIQSLTILAEQTRNKYFKRVITEVRTDVEAGSSLNQAMRKHPKAFDDLFCNLIASGEQSGSLDVMLQRLAEYIEKVVKLRSQVRSAMIYPTAIVTFALLVSIFLMWKVIPIFSSIFAELGAQLPGLTYFVIQLSNFVQNYILFIFIGLIGSVILFRYYRKTTSGRWAVDRLVLRLPLFGKLMRKVSISRVTRTLSTLLSGGVSMLESLKITSSTAGNILIEKSVMDARKQVTEGRSLTDAFRSTGRFPFMMTQMVSVGEATGTLDRMLAKLSDFYEDEVSSSVSALISILEPMMMIFVGGIVGVLILSMYLPIFNLMSQIQ